MDPEALVVLVLCSMAPLIFTILLIVKGYREKERICYIVAIIPFLMFLAFVCIVLNLPKGLFLIFMIFMLSVAVASIPSAIKYGGRKAKEWFAKFDASAPLRYRDLYVGVFLTRYSMHAFRLWLRLVSRYGLKKYVFLTWLCVMPAIGGLIALILWPRNLNIGYIIGYTFLASAGFAIMYYYYLKLSLKWALKEKELPERESVYRSVNAEDLYRKLLDAYTPIWGSRLGAIRDLENKIRSCMKQGISREEAIRKIAAWEFEGIPWET